MYFYLQYLKVSWYHTRLWFNNTSGRWYTWYNGRWYNGGPDVGHPSVIAQNKRMSVEIDSQNTYILTIKDIQKSDAGKYTCKIDTRPEEMSISGYMDVVGK